MEDRTNFCGLLKNPKAWFILLAEWEVFLCLVVGYSIGRLSMLVYFFPSSASLVPFFFWLPMKFSVDKKKKKGFYGPSGFILEIVDAQKWFGIFELNLVMSSSLVWW